MTTYRTGNHWGRTIVRQGAQPPDEQDRRPDDKIVGLMDTPELAQQAVNGGLNASELERFAIRITLDNTNQQLRSRLQLTCGECLTPVTDHDWPATLDELVQRAGEHAEVCG